MNRREQVDVLVIGSGFGGSVVAARLTQAGTRVLLIERGPWRDTFPIRAAVVGPHKPLPRDGGIGGLLRGLRGNIGGKRGIRLNKNGYLELWLGDGVTAPCASSVGGGSHLWAGVLDQPAAGYWNNRAPGLNGELMRGHYLRVRAELGASRPTDPSSVPNHADFAWRYNAAFTPLDPGEQPDQAILYPAPEDAGVASLEKTGFLRQPIDYTEPNGLFGSTGASKTTVDVAYLLPALRDGLEVRAMHEARRIRCDIEGGYCVEVTDLESKERYEIGAEKVVLCAGALNTNSLMRASVNARGLGPQPALGQGLSANGDLVGTWPADPQNPVPTSEGAPVHGRVKIRGHEEAAYVLIGGVEALPLPGFLGRMADKNAAREYTIIAMGDDAADGVFWFDRGREKLAFAKNASPSYATARKAFEALGDMSGRPVKYADDAALTLNPLGGCRISRRREDGVVDGSGQVHGHPGLFIADGSVFPQPLGFPPALSIAAWASNVAEAVMGAAIARPWRAETPPPAERDGLCTVVVAYRVAAPTPREAVLEGFRDAGPQIENPPGLVRTYITYDEASQSGQNIYLFKTQSDARAYFDEGFMTATTEMFGNRPEVMFMDTLMVVDPDQQKAPPPKEPAV